MSGRSITIRDVARLANVSPATVSNVLGGRKSVRPASREAVMKAVTALDYRTDPVARYLRSGRTRVVAAVVPDLENPFFTAFVAAVERHCQQNGYELFVASSEESREVESRRLRSLLQWRPAAFFIMPTGHRLDAREELEAAKVPCATADRLVADGNHDFVGLDNVAGGRKAAEHLIGLGHRRIGAFAPSMAVGNIQERVAGISAALAVAGAPAPVLVDTGHGRGDLSPDDLPGGVTACIALTNFTTLQLLGVLTRDGRRIPEDVSLVGFDDYDWMNVASPSITAVRQPIARMGERVWQLLAERIGGSGAGPVRERFAPELIVRGSTAKAAV